MSDRSDLAQGSQVALPIGSTGITYGIVYEVTSTYVDVELRDGYFARHYFLEPDPSMVVSNIDTTPPTDGLMLMLITI